MREEITKELEYVQQDDIDNEGKKSILSKDKVRDLLGRSPDYADMLMMRMYFVIKENANFEVNVF